MSLTSEAQALFDHAKNSLPRWLFAGRQTVSEWLYGFVAVMDPVRALGQEWLDGVFLNTATGRWLDQHAKDRDVVRRASETDDVLRERVRQVSDAVTDQALQSGINTILGATITLASTNTITISDADNGTKTIAFLADTYGLSSLVNTIRDSLNPGWTIRLLNGKVKFAYTDTYGPANFDIDISTELRTALQLPLAITPWCEAQLGPYESDDPIPGACAINQLRRDRAFCKSTAAPAFHVSEKAYVNIVDQENSEVTIGIPAGRYSVDQIVSLLLTNSPRDVIDNWSITNVGGAISFSHDYSIFSVTWSNATIRSELGFLVDATNYDSSISGPYVGTAASPLSFSYLSRGYRATYANRPMGYVVILPYGTSSATANAVSDYLRQYGPAGYNYYVETRQSP